jgi:2-polyprenyl-3-methyl-5-hydroxy-6-metoxy-1,4-benzoquinol methylase
MIVCPICQSNRPSKAWQYKESSIFECQECDLQFVNPMAAASLEFYQEKYREYVASAYEDIHPGYQFTIDKIKEVTTRHMLPDRRRAIEVGCGAGYLLVELQKNGFECLGTDFNPALVKAAIEQFHVPARVVRLEELATLGLRFDLAILSQVLEHAEDPLRLLKDIREILNPGGILMIDVPNRNWYSPSHSLEKGTLSSLDYPPHHLTFWSIASLDHAVRRSDYSVLECIYRPFDDMNRVEAFVSRRLKLQKGIFFSAGVRTVRWVGGLLRLQGPTLHVVARR